MTTYNFTTRANNNTVQQLLTACVTKSFEELEKMNQGEKMENLPAYVYGRQIGILEIMSEQLGSLWLWGCDTFAAHDAIIEAARVILSNAEKAVKANTVCEFSILDAVESYDRVTKWANDKTNHTENHTTTEENTEAEEEQTTEEETTAEAEQTTDETTTRREIVENVETINTDETAERHPGNFAIDYRNHWAGGELVDLHEELKSKAQPDTLVIIHYCGNIYTAGEDVKTVRQMFGESGYPSTLVTIGRTESEIIQKAQRSGKRVAIAKAEPMQYND